MLAFSDFLSLDFSLGDTSYNCLNARIVVETRYYDEDLLARLGMLNDITLLFVRGGIGQFLEIKEHTYRDLTLEFLRALYVEVTKGLNVKLDIYCFICMDNYMN